MMTFLAILTLIFLTIVFRIQAKRWTAPGALFAGYWVLNVIGALILAPDGYPVTAGSIWWITLSVFSLGIGSMLGRSNNNPIPANIEEKTQLKQNNLKRTVIIFSCLGFIGVFVLLKSLGHGFGIFFSLNTIQNIAVSVSQARYTEGYTPSGLYNLFLSFNYASAFLGGMCRALNKTKWAYLPFIPILLTTIVMTTKAGILFTVFLWLAGLLAMRVRIGKTAIKKRTVIQLCVTGAILTIVFIGSSMLRYKIYNLSSLGLVYEKLTVYYVGFLSGFSQWFNLQGYQFHDLGFGQFTAAGLFDILGLQQRNQGIFNGSVTVGHYETNIYTLFRYLIQDFGLSGSLIVLVFIGFFAGCFYENTRRGSYFALPFLAMFYAQVLFSNTTTIFGYNTILLAWVISAFYISKNGFAINKKSVNSQKTTVPLQVPKRKFKKYKITW